MAGIQVTIAAGQVDSQRLGYQAISLVNFTGIDAPKISAGSKVEVGGALYQFTADETITGLAGIGNSNTIYILLTPAGASITASGTTTAPAWSVTKQGWYTGANRVIGFLWKNAAGQYVAKELLGPLVATLGKLRHLPMDELSRAFYNSAPATIGNWNGQYVVGTLGIPSIARGLRVRAELLAYSTAAGNSHARIILSDSTIYNPTNLTAAPMVETKMYATAGAQVAAAAIEVDVPLDVDDPAVYMLSYLATNVTLASSTLTLTAVGYYMGD